jgi:type I restriction enzyme S subunit
MSGVAEKSVGYVANNWKCGRLGDFVTLQRGFDLPKRLRENGPVPIVTSSGIEDFHSESKVNCPGVVTGRYGTIGNVFYLKQNFWPLNTTLFVSDFQGNDPQFVSYFLKTIDFETHSGKSGVPGVNRNDLHQEVVHFPPTLAEQEAIASALSDADALIESLEQLLVKKRQIKQGAMQELLTGRMRLAGFDDSWRSISLGDIGVFLKGSGVRKDEANSGDLPCVRYGEIYTRHSDHVREFHSWISHEVARTAVQLQNGDLLFAGSGETKEDIGKCIAFCKPDLLAYAGGDIVILRPHSEHSAFLGYYLNSCDIAEQKASKGQGDAVVHISATALGNIVCSLPSFSEQEAIADCLSSMDQDIAGTVKRLAKARQLKQAMMQQLLTGQIRLV